MREADPNQTESEAQVLTDIVEYGLHIVHVLADDDANDGARFSYTVGLWHTFEQPEVVVFGLPEEVAHSLLNALADNASEGAKYPAGTSHDDLLHGYPVRMLEIAGDKFDALFGLARWAYEGEDFHAVQLVYPDKQGRWPWDESARKGFRACQPVVGRRA